MPLTFEDRRKGGLTRAAKATPEYLARNREQLARARATVTKEKAREYGQMGLETVKRMVELGEITQEDRRRWGRSGVPNLPKMLESGIITREDLVRWGHKGAQAKNAKLTPEQIRESLEFANLMQKFRRRGWLFGKNPRKPKKT